MRQLLERSPEACFRTVFVLAIAATLALPLAARDAPSYGWLGVVLGNPRAEPEGSPDQPSPRGVSIVGVVENGPAAKAGLRAQDRIIAVDGVAVSFYRELQTMVRAMEPGRWVSLTVERGDDEFNFDARLTEHPTKPEGLRIRLAWIGVEAINLPESLRLHFGAPEDAGVMISEVEPGGPAQSAGLEVGDVVYEAGGVPVASTDELRRIVMSGGVGNTMEMVLARHGVEITVEALLAERPREE